MRHSPVPASADRHAVILPAGPCQPGHASPAMPAGPCRAVGGMALNGPAMVGTGARRARPGTARTARRRPAGAVTVLAGAPGLAVLAPAADRGALGHVARARAVDRRSGGMP